MLEQETDFADPQVRGEIVSKKDSRYSRNTEGWSTFDPDKKGRARSATYPSEKILSFSIRNHRLIYLDM